MKTVTVFVDLRAVRSPRLAGALATADLSAQIRAFQELLRGASCDALPDGVRLRVRLDVRAIARLADLVRAEADALPFWSFRLLADPPECWLEVTGSGEAGPMARAVFGALGT
jgi:hypothetical protein